MDPRIFAMTGWSLSSEFLTALAWCFPVLLFAMLFTLLVMGRLRSPKIGNIDQTFSWAPATLVLTSAAPLVADEGLRAGIVAAIFLVIGMTAALLSFFPVVSVAAWSVVGTLLAIYQIIQILTGQDGTVLRGNVIVAWVFFAGGLAAMIALSVAFAPVKAFLGIPHITLYSGLGLLGAVDLVVFLSSPAADIVADHNEGARALVETLGPAGAGITVGIVCALAGIMTAIRPDLVVAVGSAAAFTTGFFFNVFLWLEHDNYTGFVHAPHSEYIWSFLAVFAGFTILRLPMAVIGEFNRTAL